MNDVCSIELLQNAVACRLSAEEEAALHAHLEHCEACCTQMEQLAGGESWQREAAAMLTTDELDGAVPELAVWSEVDFSVDHLDPSDDPNVLGQLGGYDVLEVIGRGGMGVVLKASDRELKRFVAIKALAPHLAHSSVARKRFAREAQAAAAVVNPHVIAIHHVQPTGRLPFLIMPLLSGETLAQRLKARGPLELMEVLRIGMQAAVGLAAAHDQGLVHRDVKPANIFLEKGVERVVITDFGLARAADDISMTRQGVVAGTPEYMSPEQVRGEALDCRSDLFSLGCVLYEMATGVSPFRADSTIATVRRIVDEKPAAIASLAPELPPWFCQIVEQLISKDPTHRFSSANEISELLEQCLSHLQQPTTVPLPKSTATSDASRSDRPPLPRILLAAGFAFALIFGGILIVLELSKGKLTITSEADDIPIKIMKGDKVIDQMTVTRSGKSVRVAAGNYQVEIGGRIDGIEVEGSVVSLTRGGEATVRIVKSNSDATAAAKDPGNSATFICDAPGKFNLHGGVSLEIVEREHDEAFGKVHRAVFHWPANGEFPALRYEVDIASDKHRQWAVAGKMDAPVTWLIVEGQFQSGSSIRAIDYSTPANIITSTVYGDDRFDLRIPELDAVQQLRRIAFSIGGQGQQIPKDLDALLVKRFDHGEPMKYGISSLLPTGLHHAGGQHAEAAVTEDQWTFSGCVRTAAAFPMPNVVVTARDEYHPTIAIASATTDDEGRYQLRFRSDIYTLMNFRSVTIEPRVEGLAESKAALQRDFKLRLDTDEDLASLSRRVNEELKHSQLPRDRWYVENIDPPSQHSGQVALLGQTTTADFVLIQQDESTRAEAQELDRKNARSVVEAYVAAVLVGRIDKAASLAKSSPAGRQQIERLSSNLNRNRLNIKSLYVNDPAKPTKVLATSEAATLETEGGLGFPGRRDDFLVLTLTMTEEAWFVTEVDHQSKVVAEGTLQRFLEANPSAVGLLLRPEDAEAAEREVPGDTAAKLLARLQGEWKAMSVDQGNGKMIGEQEVVIRDHVGIVKYFQDGKLGVQTSFELSWMNPGRPEEVQVTFDPNSGDHEPFLGLIECDGKSFRLCCQSETRPRALCPGDGVFYIECTWIGADTDSKNSDATIKTVTPRASQSAKVSGNENTLSAGKDESPPRTASNNFPDLQGDWIIESFYFDEDVNSQELQEQVPGPISWILRVEGNQLLLRGTAVAGMTRTKAGITLKPVEGNDPCRFNVVNEPDTQSRFGMYKVVGDKLTILLTHANPPQTLAPQERAWYYECHRPISEEDEATLEAIERTPAEHDELKRGQTNASDTGNTSQADKEVS